MKLVSQVLAVIGAIAVLLAVYGRFHGAPTITLQGRHFAAGSLLLVGNTILLLGVFLALLSKQDRKPNA